MYFDWNISWIIRYKIASCLGAYTGVHLSPFVVIHISNSEQIEGFLDAFSKLRKATISFVTSVRPSEWNKLGSHWTDFHELWYLRIFLKICRENSSSIKTGQEQQVLYMETDVHFYHIISWISLWRRIFFLILAHPVYKMWITQEPKKVALWNKRYF